MIPANSGEPSGSWDSIHVFEVAERGRQAHYKLTSTIMLQLTTRKGGDEGTSEGNGKAAIEGWKHDGEVDLSGSMTRQVTSFLPSYSCSSTVYHLPHHQLKAG
jgi:capping protein (actin filament) muscle Z-line, beta